MILALNLHPMLELTDEQFNQICRVNPDLRLERTANGELLVMPPTGGETGGRNSSLTGQLWAWNRQNKLGRSFDSSSGFRLPNGAIRSPDAAWIRQERWDALTPEEKQSFVPLCPDFVVELRSHSNSREDLQAKMQEYLANGIRLGWLIDPKTKQVEIYRPDQVVEIQVAPLTLSGETVLSGFVLDLEEIWND